nr:unnamed protein product [Callosobruchus analis]
MHSASFLQIDRSSLIQVDAAFTTPSLHRKTRPDCCSFPASPVDGRAHGSPRYAGYSMAAPVSAFESTDDTNILVKGDGILDVKHKSNKVFKSSKEWFTRNRLIKQMGCYFETNRANIHEPEYLNIDDTHVKLTKTVKFLGLIVDNTRTLSWSEHVESIQKRLSSSIYSLRVLKRYTDNDTIKSVYHATVESHIRYGIVMYGGCSAMRKLFVTQKRALRTILGMNKRDSCRGRFRDNRILTVYAIFVQEYILFLRKNETAFYNARPQTAYSIRYFFFCVFKQHRLLWSLAASSPIYHALMYYSSYLPVKSGCLQECHKFNYFRGCFQ